MSSDSEGNSVDLLTAIDPNLFSNSLFNKDVITGKGDIDTKKDTIQHNGTKHSNGHQKSQRYLEIEETFCTDLKIPESMQDHFRKRLSILINDKIEFVTPNEIPSAARKKKEPKSRLKLLQNFNTFVNLSQKPEYKIPQEKPIIKRREIEPCNLSEFEKIRMSAVDIQYILSKEEIKSWKGRKNPTIFKYKVTANSTLQFIEPENEFTKLRKKNCWSEKRISRSNNKVKHKNYLT